MAPVEHPASKERITALRELFDDRHNLDRPLNREWRTAHTEELLSIAERLQTRVKFLQEWKDACEQTIQRERAGHEPEPVRYYVELAHCQGCVHDYSVTDGGVDVPNADDVARVSALLNDSTSPQPAEPAAWVSSINPKLVTADRVEANTWQTPLPLYRAAQPQVAPHLREPPHCSTCACGLQVCDVCEATEGRHHSDCILVSPRPAQPPPSDYQDETITSLCDRLLKINNICHDRTLRREERLRQVEEWSAGFMHPPGSGPTKETAP